MCMGNENVMNFFWFKTKGSPVYLVRAFTLIETGFNKNIETVAFDIKTGAGNRTGSSKKFEYQMSPLIPFYPTIISGVIIH